MLMLSNAGSPEHPKPGSPRTNAAISAMTAPSFRRHLLALLMASAVAASGAPGELDVYFGEGGHVLTDPGPPSSGGFKRVFATGLAQQDDGKLVVAGAYVTPTESGIAVARYDSDGALDPGFGTGGVVATPLATSLQGRGVVVQADGKLLFLARSLAGDIVLVRYTSAGVLDPAFDGDGVLISDLGAIEHPHGVALQGDGKILVAGSQTANNDRDVLLVRYTSAGALDTSFNGTGFATLHFGEYDDGYALAVQPDGRIVLAASGGFVPGVGDVIRVVRYLPTGVLDPSFIGGFTGIESGALPTSMVLQPDGKIVVAGNGFRLDTGATGLAVARFTSSGSLDPTFNGTGSVLTLIGGLTQAFGVGLQSDGKIVVCGYSGKTGSPRTVVARYTTSGALDTSFGGTGTIMAGFDDGSAVGEAVTLTNEGKIVVAEQVIIGDQEYFGLSRFYGGDLIEPTPEPVLDTKAAVLDDPGTTFTAFGTPAIDDGMVGGVATLKGSAGRQTGVYLGDGSVAIRSGDQDAIGGTYLSIGDPVFGGEALGFASTARQPVSAELPLPLRLDQWRSMPKRAFAVRPGGKLAALYSRLTRASGTKRLAAQADPAPGGGQFARFGSFGLPRQRGGLIYTAKLHRGGGVTAGNDFGVWREKLSGGDSDLLLRHGQPLDLGAAGMRTLKKTVLMAPVPNATDQRQSFATDGSVGATAIFADGSSGVVQVAPNGNSSLVVETTSDVPNELGAPIPEVEFVSFKPPAVASGGKVALVAALKAATRGSPAPKQAIFARQGGGMRKVVAQGDAVQGLPGVRWQTLGQPLLGEQGMIGLIGTLTGRGVKPANRKVIGLADGNTRAVVARLGDKAFGIPGEAVYRRFVSVVVTDSDPVRLLFTAQIGGKGVKARDNFGMWSFSKETGSTLILRKGGPVMITGEEYTLRTFDALQAPRKNMGQGRSTDESGFVTVKAKLSDGRQGVLRIPLP